MNKSILQRYAEIKNQIKALEEELEPLQIEIVTEMDLKETDEIELENVGFFIRGVRRTYIYPEEIEKAVIELKEKKKEAEAKGTASYSEKPYLIYKQSKVE